MTTVTVTETNQTVTVTGGSVVVVSVPSVTVVEVGGGSVDAAGLTRVTIDLSTDDIATLRSDPVPIVVAQGGGTAIIPVSATFQYKAGSHPFERSGENLNLKLGAAIAESQLSAPPFDGITSALWPFQVMPSIDMEQAENTALLLQSDDGDPGYTGSILTHSLGSGGSGYAPGGTGTVLGLLGADVTYTIDTVDGGGAVLTYHLTGVGSGYGVRGYATAETTGGGNNDFVVSVDSITSLSDGTGRITVLYYVMELA